MSSYIETLCSFRQGLLHLERGQYRQAVKSFSQAITGQESNDVFHLHLGLAQSRMGEWKEAHQAFGRAWELNPQNLDAAYGLALALKAQGEAARAEQVYRQVQALAGAHWHPISPKLLRLAEVVGIRPPAQELQPLLSRSS